VFFSVTFKANTFKVGCGIFAALRLLYDMMAMQTMLLWWILPVASLAGEILPGKYFGHYFWRDGS